METKEENRYTAAEKEFIRTVKYTWKNYKEMKLYKKN